VLTRKKAADILEYNQQRENDCFIREVLSHFPAEDDDLFTYTVAPELLHLIESMETRNINMWETIFRDDAWRSVDTIEKAPGFASTHPGGMYLTKTLAATILGANTPAWDLWRLECHTRKVGCIGFQPFFVLCILPHRLYTKVDAGICDWRSCGPQH